MMFSTKLTPSILELWLKNTNIKMFLALKALKKIMKSMETKGIFQFEIIINVLVSSF